MFAKIFSELTRGERVDSDLLKRRFDVAMTKKLGVVKLPPSFWMQDPKINPRTDHLLWAALLLNDPDRVALAFSALAVEHDEQQKKQAVEARESMGEVLDRFLQQFLELLPEGNQSQRERIQKLVAELM